jgi:hypothetical protein
MVRQNVAEPISGKILQQNLEIYLVINNAVNKGPGTAIPGLFYFYFYDMICL